MPNVLPTLTLDHFGPVRNAEMKFGRLTLLVGPQATGKSLALQALKLVVDTDHIVTELKRAGIDWAADPEAFVDVYFGEGLRDLWGKRTRVRFCGEGVHLRTLLEKAHTQRSERVLYVPAQRVLTIGLGWPQAFTHFSPGVPFAVREFSERLRRLMDEFGRNGVLFPEPRRLKRELRLLLDEHIFGGFQLRVERGALMQKRLILAPASGGDALPVMVWSAGQREFVPLLLGLYWLVTSGARRRRGVEWVVLEEPEMGLHPRAIAVVMLLILELVARGYRVVVSSHSHLVLDAAWAIRILGESKAAPEHLLRVFDAPRTPALLDVAGKCLRRTPRVYYFDRSGTVHNISQLDPDAEAAGQSGWGGLAEFSSRANDVVAHVVANSPIDGAS
jgi:energy-coupling factor transporter ATP-binding protein EcfA2